MHLITPHKYFVCCDQIIFHFCVQEGIHVIFGNGFPIMTSKIANMKTKISALKVTGLPGLKTLDFQKSLSSTVNEIGLCKNQLHCKVGPIYLSSPVAWFAIRIYQKQSSKKPCNVLFHTMEHSENCTCAYQSERNVGTKRKIP